MGSKVEALEKEIVPPEPVFYGLAITIILGGMFFFMSTFDRTGGAALLGLIANLAGTIGFPILVFLFILNIYTLKADPQKFVEAYRKDEPQTSEIEILEKAYSKAHDFISESFQYAVILWLAFGITIGLIEIAVVTGSLEVKDSTRFWALIGLSSLLSAASFILMVVFYLRKRSIEKALFAIQFKKSDKAELSIKL